MTITAKRQIELACIKEYKPNSLPDFIPSGKYKVMLNYENTIFIAGETGYKVMFSKNKHDYRAPYVWDHFKHDEEVENIFEKLS